MRFISPLDSLTSEEIAELGRKGEHPFGWYLIETDALSYWLHLPHKRGTKTGFEV